MLRTVALCRSRSRAAEATTASPLKTWAQSLKALLEVSTTAPAGVVTLADDLEEQRGLGLVQREVADLVDDEQFGPGEVSHFPVQAVFREGEGELAGQFDRAGEINPVAHLRTRASNWASAAAPAARTTNPFGSASSKVHRAGAVAPSLTSANCTADSFRRRPCKCAHFASVRRLMPSRRANCSIVRPLAR